MDNRLEISVELYIGDPYTIEKYLIGMAHALKETFDKIVYAHFYSKLRPVLRKLIDSDIIVIGSHVDFRGFYPLDGKAYDDRRMIDRAIYNHIMRIPSDALILSGIIDALNAGTITKNEFDSILSNYGGKIIIIGGENPPEWLYNEANVAVNIPSIEVEYIRRNKI